MQVHFDHYVDNIFSTQSLTYCLILLQYCISELMSRKFIPARLRKVVINVSTKFRVQSAIFVRSTKIYNHSRQYSLIDLLYT